MWLFWPRVELLNGLSLKCIMMHEDRRTGAAFSTRDLVQTIVSPLDLLLLFKKNMEEILFRYVFLPLYVERQCVVFSFLFWFSCPEAFVSCHEVLD